MLKKFFAITLAIVSISIVQVHASALNNMTVPGVMNEMSNITNSITGLLKENDGIVTDNANLMKKNKLWQEQLDTRLKPLVDIHIAKSEAHVAREQTLTAKINQHNSGCTGTVPRPVYNRCKGEEPYLKAASSKHMAEKKVLQDERASLDKEWKSYVTLINGNQKTINENFKRHVEIKDQIRAYERTLEQYRTILITLCAKADIDRDGEAIHHCQSMRWDGSKRTLPSLDTILKGTRFFGK